MCLPLLLLSCLLCCWEVWGQSRSSAVSYHALGGDCVTYSSPSWHSEWGEGFKKITNFSYWKIPQNTQKSIRSHKSPKGRPSELVPHLYCRCVCWENWCCEPKLCSLWSDHDKGIDSIPPITTTQHSPRNDRLNLVCVLPFALLHWQLGATLWLSWRL